MAKDKDVPVRSLMIIEDEDEVWAGYCNGDIVVWDRRTGIYKWRARGNARVDIFHSRLNAERVIGRGRDPSISLLQGCCMEWVQ